MCAQSNGSQDARLRDGKDIVESKIRSDYWGSSRSSVKTLIIK